MDNGKARGSDVMNPAKAQTVLGSRSAFHGCVVLLAVGAALLLTFAVPAEAAPTRVMTTFGPSQGGTGPGEFGFVGGTAVNQSTGEFYVVDSGSIVGGVERVQRFSADGGFLSAFGTTGSRDGEFAFNGNPAGIAVDPSDGSVYVADPGNGRVQKFQADGSFILSLGAAGTGPGEFSTPIGVAVDPRDGKVYVADRDANRVQRFLPNGTYDGLEFGSAGSELGSLSGPSGLAVDASGDVYVLDNPDMSRVQKFSRAGEFEGLFAPLTIGSPGALAVDPASDHIFVYQPDPVFPGSGYVAEFTTAGNLVESHGQGMPSFSAGGLGFSSATGNIYVTDYFSASGASIYILGAVAPPTATIQPVSDITGNSATLHGVVNPEGSSTRYFFEYSRDGNAWGAAPAGGTSAGSGAADLEVSQEVGDLLPNMQYSVRLAAVKPFGAGSATSEEVTFTTGAVPPAVTTSDASGITTTGARLGGQVNPLNSPTTYFVEYGPDTTYGSRVPASEDGDAGAGGVAEPVAVEVDGLVPGATYHFRVVAENQAGVVRGSDRTFQTLSVPLPDLPDGRVYEKITPSDKNGGDAQAGAVIDGDHVSVRATASFLDEDPFFEDSGRYLASRSDAGWALTPAFVAPKTSVADVNRAGTQEIIHQDTCEPCLSLLTADADAGGGDIYARDAQGLSLVSQGTQGGTSADRATYAGQSADGSHILFETVEHLEPADDGRVTGRQLYERIGNQTRVVGVDSNEDLISDGGAVLGNGVQDQPVPAGASDAVSDDGSVIFFESPDPDPNGDGVMPDTTHQLYARVNGADTVDVSAAQCDPACPGDPQPATFQGAAEDGSIVYFTSLGRLVNEDDDDTADLYQYRFDTGALTLLTGVCSDASGTVDCGFSGTLSSTDTSGQGVLDVSNDGQRIYFVAPPRPSGDFGAAVGNSMWLYDEHTGQTTFVAPVGVGTSNGLRSGGLRNPAARARITPDGAVLVFHSELKLTSFDNVSTGCSSGGELVPCIELYRYRVSTGTIDCISCNPTNTPPLGQTDQALRAEDSGEALWRAAGSLSFVAGGRRPNQQVSDDGRVIVFKTWDALVPRDTNRRIDIYQWHDGRVSLLTTGTSPADAELAGVTPDGRNVFFTTFDQLVPSDVDASGDLYDARIGGTPNQGGLGKAPCEGEACQPTSPRPALPAPGTSSFFGKGNSKPAKAKKPRCKAGRTPKRVRGRVRCVKKPVVRCKRSRGKQAGNPRKRCSRKPADRVRKR